MDRIRTALDLYREVKGTTATETPTETVFGARCPASHHLYTDEVTDRPSDRSAGTSRHGCVQ